VALLFDDRLFLASVHWLFIVIDLNVKLLCCRWPTDVKILKRKIFSGIWF
jgi:hypothetical protein